MVRTYQIRTGRNKNKLCNEVGSAATRRPPRLGGLAWASSTCKADLNISIIGVAVGQSRLDGRAEWQRCRWAAPRLLVVRGHQR